jgi:hypothetical protein
MARILDRTKSGGIRVEMLGGDAAIDEFSAANVGQFFSNIELKGTGAASGPKGAKIVSFDMTLSVNFAI